MRRFGRVAAVLAAAAVGVAGLVAASPASRVQAAPAVHTQVITVRVPTATYHTGVLEAWQLNSAGVYHRVAGPFTAFVGSAGTGAASETVSRTPAGVWGLTRAFGIAANPGTRLPYFRVDNLDWWVGDTHSRYYNQHYRCVPGHCPFNERASEHLLSAGAVYRYAVVIDYNTSPARAGAGSAFFFHVTNYHATAGCVATAQNTLVALMRWLNPAARPVISIGIGPQAYAAIPNRA